MEELFDGAEKKKKRTRSQEANDVLFEPLARFFFRTVGPDDAKRIMKVVRNLKAKGATPEEINVAIAAWGVVFPYCADSLSLESLNKHWDRLLMNGKGPAPPKPRRNEGIENESQDYCYQQQLKKWNEWHRAS